MFINKFLTHNILMGYLKNNLEQYKFRWKNATDKYVKTYPDKKVNGDSTQNDRSYATVLQVANELTLFQANLKDGYFAQNAQYFCPF